MFESQKGKACIISVSEFDNLPHLVGYRVDVAKLKQLWHQMGCKVYTPHIQGKLTARVLIYLFIAYTRSRNLFSTSLFPRAYSKINVHTTTVKNH